jgi:hypothetical protein
MLNHLRNPMKHTDLIPVKALTDIAPPPPPIEMLRQRNVMEHTDPVPVEGHTDTAPPPLPIEMLKLRSVMELMDHVPVEGLTGAAPHRPLKSPVVHHFPGRVSSDDFI